MTPDEVKARVVSKVTGKLGPVPLVDPELTEALAKAIQEDTSNGLLRPAQPVQTPMEAEFAKHGIAAVNTTTEQVVAVHSVRIAKLEDTVHTAELQEALESYKLGFSNVLVCRAFKALEARLASLEGRL
jgi:hypothetical protein